MNEELKNSLDRRIEQCLKQLETLEEGSDAKKSAIGDLDILYKLHLEEIKVQMETLDKFEKRRIEEENNKSVVKEQSIDRYVKIGLEIILGVGQIVFCAIYLNKGFRFEETGTFTSATNRKCQSWIKPNRR